MKRIKDKLIREGIMLFCVGLALIVTWFAIHNTDSLKHGLETINDILMPFYIGFVLAYLICPVYNGTVRALYPWLHAVTDRSRIAYRLSRFAASVVALVTLIGAIGGFCLLIIPDLIEAGVDAIHPIQAAAVGMSATDLAQYKNDLAFVGGIDAQSFFVNATPDDIEREVDRVRGILGPNIVISPSHERILPNIPIENLCAMARAAKR